jgi:hypothetical protein
VYPIGFSDGNSLPRLPEQDLDDRHAHQLQKAVSQDLDDRHAHQLQKSLTVLVVLAGDADFAFAILLHVLCRSRLTRWTEMQTDSQKHNEIISNGDFRTVP